MFPLFLFLSSLSFYTEMTIEGKYIGLILAICSSLLIGTSFAVTKKGLLNSSTKEHGKKISFCSRTNQQNNLIHKI